MKILAALLLFSQIAGAYLYTEINGKKLKWNLRNGSLDFHVNPHDENAAGINPLDVQISIEESLREWNSTSPVYLRPTYTASPPTLGGGASFRFSSNPAFFGAGVLAVTSIGYSNSSGSIQSADIIMNDSFYNPTTFTSSKSQSSGSQAYLGDVITHEIGHLLGLNHSEVAESSMIFSIFKGQFSPHSDDHKGLEALYSTHSSSRGIAGKVVGENMVPVFGAHVQVIDADSNEVVAGVFSDEEGNFAFKGLERYKSYALYMNPIRSKEHLPEYFSTFQSNFCNGKDFQPSFFSKCGGRNLGKAQIIKLNGERMLNVGNFSIKCSTGAHPEYLRQKLTDERDYSFTAFDYMEAYKTHSTFTGYFTKNEIEAGESGAGDRIKLDLSGLDVSSFGAGRVEIGVSTAKLGTAAGIIIHAQRADQSSATRFAFGTDPATGKPQLDYEFFLQLSNDSDDNIFELSVYPRKLGSSDAVSIFAAPSLMSNKTDIYFLTMQTQKNDGFGYTPLQEWEDYPYEDNSTCLEGEVRQTAKAYSPVLNSEASKMEEGQSMSCATIDVGENGGPGGGMGSFLFGLAAVSALFALRGRRYDFFV